jgi:outer membrane protein TolC
VGSAREDWRASLQSALEHRPELAQRRLDIEVAEVALQRASSLRLPLLDLSLSSASGGFDSDPNEAFDKAIGWDFPSSSATLNFSLPLWNRSARNAEHSARTSLRSAQLACDRLERDLLAEVRTAVNEVDRQRESVAASEKSRTLAQRQLEAEETRQQVGLSTTFQVLQFQEDLAQALSTEVSARVAHAKALARLSYAEGLDWPESQTTGR